MKKASGEWRVASGERGAGVSAGVPTPDSGLQTPHAGGLTLVEVLMSLMVTGIGMLGVVALLPLAFVRAVQATNLTNGTILRYNAESMIDFNPRLLLRWQPQQYSNTAYQVGGTSCSCRILPLIGFQCTTAGNVGPRCRRRWNPTVGGTTTDNTARLDDGLQNQQRAAHPPPRFVIDPLGWNALGTALQTILGNNGAGGVDPNAHPRFNGEITNVIGRRPAGLSAGQLGRTSACSGQRAPPRRRLVLNNVDLSGVGLPATATAPPSSRGWS